MPGTKQTAHEAALVGAHDDAAAGWAVFRKQGLLGKHASFSLSPSIGIRRFHERRVRAGAQRLA
eukprot:15441269-Alexandrium_andersonii.AAC.1